MTHQASPVAFSHIGITVPDLDRAVDSTPRRSAST